MISAANDVASLAASSRNDGSPKGELILRGPFGELLTVGLDDVPPEAPAGCLPLFTLASGYVPTWAAHKGPHMRDRQGVRTERSTSLGWKRLDGPIPPL